MLIECRSVRVRRGRRVVIRDLNLQLDSRESVALIGPNGSGKTTLLLALLGLIRLESGEILVDGRPLRSMTSRQRGEYGAYVPQSADHVPAYSIYDLVAGGRYLHARPMRPLSVRDDEIIVAAIERSGLAHLRDRPVDQVSGGERQKAMLAAAIAQDAHVMFLDEPTTALDPAYRIELARLIRDWHAQGRGVVCVSHDLELPAVVATRVIALRDGEIAADGSPEEVLVPVRLQAIFGAAFSVAISDDGRRHLVAAP